MWGRGRVSTGASARPVWLVSERYGPRRSALALMARSAEGVHFRTSGAHPKTHSSFGKVGPIQGQGQKCHSGVGHHMLCGHVGVMFLSAAESLPQERGLVTLSCASKRQSGSGWLSAPRPSIKLAHHTVPACAQPAMHKRAALVG